MSFISADPTGFDGGMNWYLYANANPLMFTDSTGKWFGYDDLAAAGIGAILGIAGQIIADITLGQTSSWQTYAGAAVGGAVGGVAGLYTFNPGLVGTAAGGASNTVTQVLNYFTGVQQSIDFQSLGMDIAAGAAATILPGGRQIITSAGRGSASAITKRMITGAKNGTINNISWSTALKMGATANNSTRFIQDALFSATVASGRDYSPFSFNLNSASNSFGIGGYDTFNSSASNGYYRDYTSIYMDNFKTNYYK